MTQIEAILARVGDVPPLPATSVRLMRMLNRTDTTLGDIVSTIQFDQAIVARVLRLCNSAAFGIARPVHSVREAVRFVGTQRLLHLVLSDYGSSVLNRAQSGYGLERGELWRHSVAVASGAAMLARRAKSCDDAVAFTAGLLHDIGKVILNELVGRAYERIVERVESGKATFVEAEHSVLECAHDEVGALVAGRWRLPEPIVGAIRHHHAPPPPPEGSTLIDVVHVADCLAMTFGFGVGVDGLSYRANDDVLQRLALREPDLELVGVEMAAEVKSIEAVFADDASAPVAADSARRGEVRP